MSLPVVWTPEAGRTFQAQLDYIVLAQSAGPW